jgi:hypothetical protein
MHIIVKLFLAFWFTFSIFFFLAVGTQGITYVVSNRIPLNSEHLYDYSGIIIPSLFLVAPIAMIWFGRYLLGRSEEEHIINFLEETLHAERIEKTG